MQFKDWLITENTQKEKTPKDILNSVKLNDHKYEIYKSANHNDKELLNLKYKEAKENGLLQDIIKNGIKNPIEIQINKDNTQTLIKGHHRLAIALKHFPNELIKINYTKENNTNTTWTKPDFNEEKNELIRQAKELNIKTQDIFHAFENGKLISLTNTIWNKLKNTNSNDKNLNWKLINSWKNKDVENIKKALKQNKIIQAPIILNHKNNYYCVSGNTRLSISKLLDITPKVWLIKT